VQAAANLIFQRLTDRISDLVSRRPVAQRSRAAGLNVQVHQSGFVLQIVNTGNQFLQRA